MLEKWGKQKGDVYVRRRRMRAQNRGKGKGGRGLYTVAPSSILGLIWSLGKGLPEEEGVLDVADVEDEVAPDEEHIIEEQMFTFDKFEAVCPSYPGSLLKQFYFNMKTEIC